jgi:hypothetical protein
MTTEPLTRAALTNAAADDRSRMSGWWIFAAVLLFVAAVLNVIWGIAAISDSRFFVSDANYILGSLHTWGWVTLILGVLQGFAAFSLAQGGGFGRWFGLFMALLVAIDALLAIPAYPLWSLCVFALSVIVIYELASAPRRFGVE